MSEGHVVSEDSVGRGKFMLEAVGIAISRYGLVPVSATRERRRFDEVRSEVTMSKASGSRFTAFDTNSTDDIDLGTDQSVNQLACTEVRGGNNIADEHVKLAGLVESIHLKPAEPATTGGDVYYLRVCDKSMLSRVVLADVAGHGEAVAATALKLRILLNKYINTFDQSALLREISQAFHSENGDLTQYATAAVLSYYCKTGVLVFAKRGPSANSLVSPS